MWALFDFHQARRSGVLWLLRRRLSSGLCLLGTELNVPAIKTIFAPIRDHVTWSESTLWFVRQTVARTEAIDALNRERDLKFHRTAQ